MIKKWWNFPISCLLAPFTCFLPRISRSLWLALLFGAGSCSSTGSSLLLWLHIGTLDTLAINKEAFRIELCHFIIVPQDIFLMLFNEWLSSVFSQRVPWLGTKFSDFSHFHWGVFRCHCFIVFLLETHKSRERSLWLDTVQLLIEVLTVLTFWIYEESFGLVVFEFFVMSHFIELRLFDIWLFRFIWKMFPVFTDLLDDLSDFHLRILGLYVCMSVNEIAQISWDSSFWLYR